MLPLEDEKLFRSERATLRETLARELASRLPGHAILPLASVDAKLAPVTSAGARCAFAHSSAERRASREGWWTTDLVHLLEPKGPGKLWVRVSSEGESAVVLEAPWSANPDRVAAHVSAFSQLAVISDAGGGLGLVGGLGGQRNTLKVGPLSLCEDRSTGVCAPETEALRGQAAALTKCFAGSDEAAEDFLVEPGRCEIAGLNVLSERDKTLEACVCPALLQSPATRRRTIALRFEALDLAGKPRPELRVLESSHNLAPRAEWRSFEVRSGGKTSHASVHRLEVDNLDAPRAALARCQMKPGSVVVGELSVSPTGAPSSARLLSLAGPADAGDRCVLDVLKRSAFDCTSDGEPAKLSVAVTWPE